MTVFSSSILFSLIFVSAIALYGASAIAQEKQWKFSTTVYLFAADTTTGIGDTRTSLSFSDAVDNLDFAFSGSLAATNGKLSLIADYTYTGLTYSGGVSGPIGTTARTTLTTQFLTGYAAYRVFEVGQTSVDVGGGFRWFETDTQVSIDRPSGTSQRNLGGNWIDPLIMLRGTTNFSDKWAGSLTADYGGLFSDRETSQVTISINYELSDQWLLRAGYRYIDVSNRLSGEDYSFQQSGPVLGVSVRF
ncbi:MAG: porin family protein [Pseudomonadota bacterium]